MRPELRVDAGLVVISAEASEKDLILHELDTCMDRIFLPIQKSVFLAASREGYTQRELAKKFALPMTTINNWMSRVDLMRRLVNELSRSNSEAESRGGAESWRRRNRASRPSE